MKRVTRRNPLATVEDLGTFAIVEGASEELAHVTINGLQVGPDFVASATTWGAVNDKPTVIGAGDDALEARGVLGLSKQFSTADYGQGDGGDDRPRVEQAVGDAVAAIIATGLSQTVLIHAPMTFKTGVTKPPLSSTTDPSNGSRANLGVLIPCGLAAELHIDFAPGAEIVLTEDCYTAFFIDKQADHDVFQNVIFHDARVDCGDVADAKCAALVGNMVQNDSMRYLSFQHIHFLGQTYIYNSYWDAAEDLHGQGHVGISLIGNHNGPLEATQTFSTDIYVEDIVMEGGNGIFWCMSEYSLVRPGGANHYYDDIRVGTYKYTNGGTSTAYHYHAGIFVCGGGFGDKARVGPGYVENIGDDCVEVGAMQDVVIDQPHFKNPNGGGVLLRHTHAPIDVNKQRILIRGLRGEVTPAQGAIAGSASIPMLLLQDDQAIIINSTATGGTGQTFTIPNVGTTATVARTASAADIRAAFIAAGCLSGTTAVGGPLATAAVKVLVHHPDAGVHPIKPITVTSVGLTGGTCTIDLDADNNPSFGHIIIEDPEWISDGQISTNTFLHPAMFIAGLDLPHKKIEIIRPKVVLRSYTYNHNSSNDLALLHPSGQYSGWGNVAIKDMDVILAGGDFAAGTGSFAALFWVAVTEGTDTILDIDGLTLRSGATMVDDGGGNAVITAINVGKSWGSGILAKVRRLRTAKLSQTGFVHYGVWVDSGATVTSLDVLDSDFTKGVTTHGRSVYLGAAGSNANNVRAMRNLYPVAPAGAAITVGASPFTWTNTLGMSAVVEVSAGTVSLIQQRNKGGTFTNSAFTTSRYTIEPGGELKVTYSVAPTMTYTLLG